MNKEICHVCKKEKKPYLVILDNNIMSMITHEQSREDGPICKRCDNYFAMTHEFKDATEEEFKVALDAVKFSSVMLKWWEKDNKLYSGEPDDYLPEDPEQNKRSWDGTDGIADWYRKEFLNCDNHEKPIKNNHTYGRSYGYNKAVDHDKDEEVKKDVQ